LPGKITPHLKWLGDYFTTYKNEKMVGIYIVPAGIEKEIQKLENFHSRVMYFSVSRRAP
jgi:hypothetical protein